MARWMRQVSMAFLLCLGAALILPLPVAAVTPELSSVRFNEDVNGDGRVSIMDVLCQLARLRSGSAAWTGDFNGDGVRSLADAIFLGRRINGGTVSQAEPTATSWRVVGPGGGGGQFLPTVNPADPDNVFERCDMTGAYVTYDNAKTWRMFNLRTIVLDFEFDPSDPNTVYAASGMLLRSRDKGLRWEIVYPDPADIIKEHMEGDHADYWVETAQGQPEGEQSTEVELVRVDPTNSNHLWIVHSAPWGASYYVLVSNDYGASWRRVVSDLGSPVIALFPGSWWGKPDEVLVVTQSQALLVSETSGQSTPVSLPLSSLDAADGGHDSQGTLLYVLGSNKVYRSADRGATWTSVTTSTLSGGTYNTLAVCEGKPDVVYLSCPDFPGGTFGIFRTSDRGAKWEWVYHSGWSGLVLNNLIDQGWLDAVYGPGWRGSALSIGVCASNSDIAYVTDYGGTIRTLDGGKTWNQVYSNTNADGTFSSRGLDVTGSYTLKFDPFDSLHIFAPTTDIGAFQSFDGGQSWQSGIKGVPGNWANTCYWMEFDPEVKGRAWSAWSYKHDLPRDKMFRNGFNDPAGGMMTTTDGGRTWTNASSGLPSTFVPTHFVVDLRTPAGNRTLYASGFRSGVYKSVNNGLTWQALPQVPGTNRNYWHLCLLPGGRLFALVVQDRQGSVITDGGLFRSEDSGATWTQVSLPEKVNFPNDLIYDPLNPDRLYLCAWPQMDVGEMVHGNWQVNNVGGGVLASDDGGLTWRRIFREDAHVYGAAVDPRDSNVIVINTFDNAAFRSEDRGATWTHIQGYNFKWGYRPIFDPVHPGMLYLTTFGGGNHYGPAKGDPAAFEDISNFQMRWYWGDQF
ncbi:hypothetical protein LLH00_08105 [bacterium]|nr:hypothetical protein [bacterium]